MSTKNLKILPTPASAQDRTYLSAVVVREFLYSSPIRNQLRGINVFSGDVHSRRTHFLYELAFNPSSLRIGILSGAPEEFRLASWWQTSAGAKTVIVEMIGWLYAHCCFNLPERGSHAEMWGLPRDESINE
jgi:hypothetical protein